MNRPGRLAYLLVPLAVSVLFSSLPGRAQQAPSRFAFADTTLLRDTLGLTFVRLFPLADSLAVTPDSLRAWSIRYRYSLERLVELADSLRMPVDSVGPVLDRERFNPLAAAAGKRINNFRYNSSYNIAQTSSSWVNGSDYNYVAGPLFLRNTTNIIMDRFRAGGRTSLRQTRSSVTESGWKFSPNLSLGGRANLERFHSLDPGSTNNEGESKNEMQFSVRSRQQPGAGLTSEINFFSGVLDLSNFQQVKRGLSGDLNGRVRYQRGSWLTHDLTGQVNGNLSRTGVPVIPERATTRDFSNNLRGTLGLFPGSPIGANLNYTLRRVAVETPQLVIDTLVTPADTVIAAGDTTITPAVVEFRNRNVVQPVRNVNDGVDLSMRVRENSDRYVNLTARYGTSEQTTAAVLNSRSSRRDLGFGADGRYGIAGWTLESHFTRTVTLSRFPRRALTGGYGESLRVASLDGTLTRNFGPRVVTKASGRVSLNAYRYFLIGIYPNPPVDRDQYQQNYRLEGIFTASERFNSALALDVTRNKAVNIPSASTAANNETRSYRAEWRWSYRMLRGLTASQRNTLTADYLYYDFLPQNNRLSLDYSTVTTLNAVPSPRLTVDVNHNARFQPSGTYGPLPDGIVYLSRSDENQNYTLDARIAYSPTTSLSLLLQPSYLASERSSSQGGALAPQRRSRQLNFSGGASLNLSLGPKGRVTGEILRTYRADRSTTFGTAGVAQPSPRSELDFWNGSLQLSWEL